MIYWVLVNVFDCDILFFVMFFFFSENEIAGHLIILCHALNSMDILEVSVIALTKI